MVKYTYKSSLNKIHFNPFKFSLMLDNSIITKDSQCYKRWSKHNPNGTFEEYLVFFEKNRPKLESKIRNLQGVVPAGNGTYASNVEVSDRQVFAEDFKKMI